MRIKTKPFSQQVAIVTGGGTGIGRSFAETLASAGVRVIIASRKSEVLQRTADEINKSLGVERVFSHSFDVRDSGHIESLIGFVVERYRAIDILVNNSGLAVPETVEEISDDGWEKVLQTNLRGVMQLVRGVLPHMMKEDFGDVVNISSQAGKHGYADVPSYCASKFGLLGYAEALRDHVRKSKANIRVFNFCPGLVDVENTGASVRPRAGFIHVSNLARTLMYALSLDRDVVLEDINLYAK